MIGVLTAGLALAACMSAPPSQSILGTDNAAAPSTPAQRDLTQQEKKIIAEAIAPSIRDPASAKYKWAKISISSEGSTNYCAMVNAKSPYPAYNGWQAYIVEARTVGGTVSSAVVGLIAGGKDAALVAKMCAKYGLNPNNAT